MVRYFDADDPYGEMVAALCIIGLYISIYACQNVCIYIFVC